MGSNVASTGVRMDEIIRWKRKSRGGHVNSRPIPGSPARPRRHCFPSHVGVASTTVAHLSIHGCSILRHWLLRLPPLCLLARSHAIALSPIRRMHSDHVNSPTPVLIPARTHQLIPEGPKSQDTGSWKESIVFLSKIRSSSCFV